MFTEPAYQYRGTTRHTAARSRLTIRPTANGYVHVTDGRHSHVAVHNRDGSYRSGPHISGAPAAVRAHLHVSFLVGA